MTVTGIITAILIGIVIGVLARLLLPGKQPIGMLVTILVGIVAALIGTWLAQAIGIATATPGVDWGELLVQLVVAVIGVALVSALMGRRRTGLMGRKRSGLLR
ncbi:GlsB/YeaQ/YmgE family stress response membrane protein [Mycobacterium neglectum]|uniref:GlsB/YeaQ/YmgE family stress response membrane protein n=1 Tax=Mycobacterium neglectum TaxID=242737 RepID=UPI000BFEE3B8|nr:GlsB/YeaQ/YmgE family stress response membrane protein [Mycobacterium neglectum]